MPLETCILPACSDSVTKPHECVQSFQTIALPKSSCSAAPAIEPLYMVLHNLIHIHAHTDFVWTHPLWASVSDVTSLPTCHTASLRLYVVHHQAALSQPEHQPISSLLCFQTDNSLSELHTSLQTTCQCSVHSLVRCVWDRSN